MTEVVFVAAADRLPPPPAEGRVALVDVAFAFEDGFARVTRPWFEAVGDRLAAWVDHHDHVEWPNFENDARFVLVPRLTARACPQLVTPEVVARAGRVDTLFAHADFDGLLTAVQFLLGGRPPYPEAEEDARAIDDPLGGHRLSPRGERIARGLAHVAGLRGSVPFALHARIVESLVEGKESADLTAELDGYAQIRAERERAMWALAEEAERPHPEILVVRTGRLESSDKKVLLTRLQQRATVGMVYESGWTTAACPRVRSGCMEIVLKCSKRRGSVQRHSSRWNLDLEWRAVAARAVTDRPRRTEPAAKSVDGAERTLVPAGRRQSQRRPGSHVSAVLRLDWAAFRGADRSNRRGARRAPRIPVAKRESCSSSLQVDRSPRKTSDPAPSDEPGSKGTASGKKPAFAINSSQTARGSNPSFKAAVAKAHERSRADPGSAEAPAGSDPVSDFIAGLDARDRLAALAALRQAELHGLAGYPLSRRQIKGKLWELKIGAGRIFYVLLSGEAMVLLHAYKKQGQRAPLREIAVAEERMRRVLSWKG